MSSEPGPKLPPDALGFGNCKGCKYLTAAAPQTCFACASSRVTSLAEPNERCDVCQHPYADPQMPRCRNPWCNMDNRHFDRCWAIGHMDGQLEHAIKRLKYEQMTGWAYVFGRVLAGYLLHGSPVLSREWDWIIPCPTFAAPDRVDHTQLVIDQAGAFLDGVRLCASSASEPLLVKAKPTRRMADAGGWQARRELAEGELRSALEVPRPDLVRGRRILVYDDVFTGGHTLREVARALKRDAGASEVSGVALARKVYDG